MSNSALRKEIVNSSDVFFTEAAILGVLVFIQVLLNTAVNLIRYSILFYPTTLEGRRGNSQQSLSILSCFQPI